jgi:translation initiation factor 2 subunit 2
MKTDYEKLLKRAHSQLPPEVLERKRFEIPRVRSGTIGMRTYLVNFKEIADYLNRNPQHLLRYLSRELATAGTIDGTRSIFQGKFRNDTLDRLIQRYSEEFVMCPVCKRPDTKIAKEKRLSFLVCEACGAKSSIRTV